ncbi:MAG: mannose-1-phosphate guanylyltransferase [Chitinivibrionales bacterium]|nr:mannose-1-phosphate guanylyltransferase [Chitinivibrionales bacterium]
MNVVPVILAGGIGERFWPLSRSRLPKQLLPLISERSMIEETYSRIEAFQSPGVKPLMVTGKNIAPQIQSLLPSHVSFDYIVEPVGKNTAPAIAIAAEWIRRTYGESSIMVVLPADHAITPHKDFIEAAQYAIATAASTDHLVVFGITPIRPDTGYGYILLGDQISSQSALKCFKVQRFVEKPDVATAQKYLNSKKYLWNSGMFVWKVSVILEEFKQHLPSIAEGVAAVGAQDFSEEALYAFYSTCIKESIDYGIMEKSKRVHAICGTFQWDDVGSWESLSRILPSDDHNTVVSGQHIYQRDCRGSIITNKSPMTVATIGLTDVIVVAVDDAVLVISRDKLPDFKNYLNEMKKDSSIPSDLF